MLTISYQTQIWLLKSVIATVFALGTQQISVVASRELQSTRQEFLIVSIVLYCIWRGCLLVLLSGQKERALQI